MSSEHETLRRDVLATNGRPDRRRVVVTGMGAITPVGNSVAEMWDSLVSGRSGAGLITVLDVTGYPCQIGCELKDFNPEDYMSRKDARHMASATQLAVAAAGTAIKDARLDFDHLDGDRIGVIVGTAGGSTIEETEQVVKHFMNESKQRVSPAQIMRMWSNMPSYFVSKLYGLRGYSLTVCTACASGTQAIGEAAHVIQRGEAKVMIAIGTETLISEPVLAGFTSMRALPTNYNDRPEQAMRPFDADREGFIAGIGSAVLVLEELDHALARGARPYAELLGSATSNDAFHMIAPEHNGSGAALAMSRALANAGVEPSAINYINAHGTSTPLGDVSETKAIKAVFGEGAYDIPISSTKSMLGHMMGAAGAVEAVACVMTIKDGIIHPTINQETPDPDCDLDYVPNVARKADVTVALSNSFGLGGQNACIVLGRI
jgi:3-oxoacyl-[acyl-carrier-protein] synthase II